MASVITNSIGWTADASGESLTIRANRARDIAAQFPRGNQYRVDIKEYRKKRSLDQNALYWAVLGRFAKAISLSSPEAHNLMLRRYGQLERYGDQLVYIILPDTEEAERQAALAETYHLKPTSGTKPGKDGVQRRVYLLLRGSSTYDTAEMTRLIDGLLDECKQMGLDVLTEEERSLLEDTNVKK